MNSTAPYRFVLPTRTEGEVNFLENLEWKARLSSTSNVERFMHFPLWAPRQAIGRFLVQWEIFRMIQNVQGSIVECGVAFGGGLMAWAHFLSIADPYAHHRRVVGFDTFQGFAKIAPEDAKAESQLNFEGGMAIPLKEEIAGLAALHDANRPVGHIPRVELVEGDACVTIPQYVQDNPELVVSALVLDFDVYAPTKVALETLLPRMPKGAVLVFDEVGVKDWPGETLAVLPYLRSLKIQRFPWASTISYAVLE